MKLKAIYHGDELCLATEAGEIIESVETCRVFSTGMGAMVGQRIPCHFSIIVNLAVSEKIIDADERALPTRTHIERTEEEFDDRLDELRRPPFVEYDYDPDEGPFFYNDAFEEGDIMEGLCPDCCQDLCLQCEQCCTPACEAENCDCP